MDKETFIAIACDCYCKTCDTKECEEFGVVAGCCDWVNKFERKLKREIKKNEKYI